MCGIAGIVDLRGRREISPKLLTRMNDSLRHRGPDGDGVHLEPGVALAHRRLSIIDLSGGKQPLYNEDGSVVVTFNGEIYNFKSLRQELLAAGHQFRTASDTEVLVHGWEQWGADLVLRLDGMFAFVLWDRNRETLFMARDRLGKKPLYYTVLPDGMLLFGSEMKALLRHPEVPRQLDVTAVEDYFTFGYVPDSKSILLGVHKLPPATTLELPRGQALASPHVYWDVKFHCVARGEQDACEELVKQLRSAVSARLIADVPLGAFLSGGVDSSAVVSQMAAVSSGPVRTCSISFGNPEFDESRFAAMVAERYGTDHSAERVDADDYDLIDTLVDIYDEPFADSSAIPTYRVCQLARRRVTVALSGDAGDETLAGYRRYRWHLHEERVRRALPLALRKPLFGWLGRVYPKLDWAPRVLRAKSTLQALARDTTEGYLHSVSIMTDDMRRRLFSESFRRQLGGYRSLDGFREIGARAPTDDPLAFIQYLDMRSYLPGDILVKVDRASMAHSLEVRVPMLDHHFIEWAATLAPDLRYRHGEGKYVLKRAMEPYLPKELLYRPKMGFAVPIHDWFRRQLKQRVRQELLEGRLSATGIFAPEYLRTLLDEHQTGRRDHSAPLWSLLMFNGFCRRVLDGGGSS